VVSFTPRSLYSQEKSPWYSFDRRLGGPHSRSGSGGEEINSHKNREIVKNEVNNSWVLKKFSHGRDAENYTIRSFSTPILNTALPKLSLYQSTTA
jgi:hypothetical protein